MCLACHDGNVAKGAMMQNYAYEQQIGALPSSYGIGHIPTLLGNDGIGVGIYNNDHPVGEQALISAALGTTYGCRHQRFDVYGITTSIHSVTAAGQYAAVHDQLRRSGPA